MADFSWKKDPASEEEAVRSEYWYPGSTEPHPIVRTACRLAWPRALYYASRYHSDTHVAHELMDEAVTKAHRYCVRDGKEKTVQQVWNYVISCLKRLSIRRSSRPEVLAGNLSDLELIAQHINSDAEERVLAFEQLEKMSQLGREIFEWRTAGHSFRTIAGKFHTSHTTIMRVYHRELRALLFPEDDDG